MLRVLGERVVLTCPPSEDDGFLVLEPSWLAERASGQQFAKFAAVGDWVLRTVAKRREQTKATTAAAQTKKSEKSKKRAQGSDDDDDDDDDNDGDDDDDDDHDGDGDDDDLQGSGVDLSLSASMMGAEALPSALAASIEKDVQQANAALGTEVFSFAPDLGLVRMTFTLGELGCADTQLDEVLETTLTQRYCIHFSFVTSDNIPTAKVSCVLEHKSSSSLLLSFSRPLCCAKL